MEEEFKGKNNYKALYDAIVARIPTTTVVQVRIFLLCVHP